VFLLPTSAVHPSSTERYSVGSFGDGAIAFDDTSGAVSGTWRVGRRPSTTPGLLIYIWCDSVVATIDAVIAQGEEVVQPIGADTISVQPVSTQQYRIFGKRFLGQTTLWNERVIWSIGCREKPPVLPPMGIMSLSKTLKIQEVFLSVALVDAGDAGAWCVMGGS